MNLTLKPFKVSVLLMKSVVKKRAPSNLIKAAFNSELSPTEHSKVLAPYPVLASLLRMLRHLPKAYVIVEVQLSLELSCCESELLMTR